VSGLLVFNIDNALGMDACFRMSLLVILANFSDWIDLSEKLSYAQVITMEEVAFGYWLKELVRSAWNRGSQGRQLLVENRSMANRGNKRTPTRYSLQLNFTQQI